MEKLHKQISMFRDMEDFAVFLAIVIATNYIVYNIGLMNGRVAPRAGAWIETGEVDEKFVVKDVAPRAGAWIETT